jgi:hypothetical protein
MVKNFENNLKPNEIITVTIKDLIGKDIVIGVAEN